MCTTLTHTRLLCMHADISKHGDAKPNTCGTKKKAHKHETGSANKDFSISIMQTSAERIHSVMLRVKTSPKGDKISLARSTKSETADTISYRQKKTVMSSSEEAQTQTYPGAVTRDETVISSLSLSWRDTKRERRETQGCKELLIRGISLCGNTVCAAR